MEVICSGEVSDAAPDHLAERGILNNNMCMESVGLRYHFRFKYDIFAVVDLTVCIFHGLA
eukprot:6559660-Pyramimonas_sp.AAC.1